MLLVDDRPRINGAILIEDPCLTCGHDCSEHEDTADAFCTICDCDGLHLHAGDCTEECHA